MSEGKEEKMSRLKRKGKRNEQSEGRADIYAFKSRLCWAMVVNPNRDTISIHGHHLFKASNSLSKPKDDPQSGF